MCVVDVQYYDSAVTATYENTTLEETFIPANSLSYGAHVSYYCGNATTFVYK